MFDADRYITLHIVYWFEVSMIQYVWDQCSNTEHQEILQICCPNNVQSVTSQQSVHVHKDRSTHFLSKQTYLKHLIPFHELVLWLHHVQRCVLDDHILGTDKHSCFVQGLWQVPPPSGTSGYLSLHLVELYPAVLILSQLLLMKSSQIYR